MSDNRTSKNIYRLPFNVSVDIRPAPFHFEEAWQRNAVDFALDVGTPILAVDDGLVSMVNDSNGDGQPEKRYLSKANRLMIEHLDGEFSGYCHLRKGILVREGQKVTAGQIVGYSGISGYTTYPHLHYQTMVKDQSGRYDWVTIQTRFIVNGEVQVLVSPRK